ncbi:MAG: GTPase [Acidimicrobiia bacterium]
MAERRVVIAGAGGRDFHDFNMVFRDDASVEVVAFTAAQIPGIDRRRYPAELAGSRYANGIAIVPEHDLDALIERERIDEVVLAYSDLAHPDVMHIASRVLAAGADFRLLGPRATMLRSVRPVVAVCGTRTGVGKSPITRRIGGLFVEKGKRVAVIRHPMPYGDLNATAVQRFETMADIDGAHPTIEEREEYEEHVRQGLVVYAGVDYEAILRRAESEADVVVWDGGNNDFPFVRPDVLITVADALRPGHELAYHPGETNFRMADVIVVNKVDSATPVDVARVVANAALVNERAIVVRTASPVTLDEGVDLAGKRVLVVDDGPTITHGGMAYGAGFAAAVAGGATTIVDPRPHAVGTIADAYHQFPHIASVLPALGYSDHQRHDLERTVANCRPDVIVTGTPIDLMRLISVDVPVRRARYGVQEVGRPTLAEALAHLGIPVG